MLDSFHKAPGISYLGRSNFAFNTTIIHKRRLSLLKAGNCFTYTYINTKKNRKKDTKTVENQKKNGNKVKQMKRPKPKKKFVWNDCREKSQNTLKKGKKKTLKDQSIIGETQRSSLILEQIKNKIKDKICSVSKQKLGVFHV